MEKLISTYGKVIELAFVGKVEGRLQPVLTMPARHARDFTPNARWMDERAIFPDKTEFRYRPSDVST